MDTSADNSVGHRPGGIRRRTWAIIGVISVVASFVLLPITAAGSASNAAIELVLILLTFLTFSWGIFGGIVNATGLSALRRATLGQVCVGILLFIVGLWFMRQDAGEPVIFSAGLLVYPGVALIVNPLIVGVVGRRRSGR